MEVFYVGCVEEITTPGVEITSPGYPDKYPHNIDCSHIIRFDDDQRITLTFLNFSLYRPKYGPPAMSVYFYQLIMIRKTSLRLVILVLAHH